MTTLYKYCTMLSIYSQDLYRSYVCHIPGLLVFYWKAFTGVYLVLSKKQELLHGTM